MAKNYLIHYGVKKSQWSPQARARYDAKHRPKEVSDANNTSGSFGPAQSEAYKQLTPKEREQARKLSEFSKRARKQYKYFGKFIPKYIAKKIDKYSSDGDRQNKYAEDILRNRKFKTGTAGQSVGTAHIIKRQPGDKQVAANKNGKGRSDGTTKHIGRSQSDQMTGASLPKAGFIFKRPQARTVGKDLYKATKKEAHKIKKQNDAAKKEDKKAVDAYNRNLERNKREYMKGTSTETDFWGNTRKVKNSEIFKSKNPFDRIATSYIPMKTSDNKVVRFLKRAYNELGYDFNSTKEEQKAAKKRYKEREKEKKKKQKEYEKQKKARQKSK